MNNIYCLFFFIVSFFSVQAEISGVLLSENQYKSIISLNNLISGDSEQLNLVWKNDTALSKISSSDFFTIIQLIKPVNEKIYKDSLVIYALCKKIAKELTDKILVDISSENADEKVSVSGELKFEKGPFFTNNLNWYFQNQIFDFFYNNKVVNVLYDAEYVKLLKPKAIYKLLKDTKTEVRLSGEILFIAKNSKYKLTT